MSGLKKSFEKRKLNTDDIGDIDCKRNEYSLKPAYKNVLTKATETFSRIFMEWNCI